MSTDDKFGGVGEAVWNCRDRLARDRSLLEAISSAVDRPVDLGTSQYAQLYCAAVDFRPDLIIEVGRGYGNSTSVLTTAANRLGDTAVVSLCLSDSWFVKSREKVLAVVPDGWSKPLDARITDVRDVDFAPLLMGRKSVMVLWDAHGWAVSEYLLARLMPLLAERRHLVLVHDFYDAGLHPEYLDYKELPCWTGYPGDDVPPRYVHVDGVISAFEELVCIQDFAWRNGFRIRCAEAEVRKLHEDPDKAAELRRLLGGQFSDPFSSYHWFDLGMIPAGRKPRYPSWTRPAPPPPPPPPPPFRMSFLGRMKWAVKLMLGRLPPDGRLR